MKTLLMTVMLSGWLAAAYAAREPGNLFTARTDVGNPRLPGYARYEPAGQSWLLAGAGYNIWNDRDEFFYLSLPASGDYIFSASLEWLGAGSDPHRKAGLMFRSSLGDDASYVDVALHGDGLTSLQYRTVKGGETREIASQGRTPGFVQLEKSGNTFILRISGDQTPPDEVASVTADLGDHFHAGLFVCSHNPEVIEQARFRNVRLDVPARLHGGEEAPPSPARLELLDIESGTRELLFSTPRHIEAPNWSRDGKFLLYNLEGDLFRYNLKNGKVRKIPAGFADENNNDHGISFDGKTLAISHHTMEQGTRHSIIYTLPVRGGIPVRITALGPSYWHGWSPDGAWLSYCAERNGEYDVYRIPSSGGEEERLTTAPGLDDGPEYSPDGRHIYFNSVRSGTMQIWRMKPDGSDQEQVTSDQFNNWFPHPSPDGKWIVFISYFPGVPPGSHPRNEPVMIRIRAADGGPVRCLAVLYGGQGTLNVPSWSPDSRKVAFVSYTY